MTGIREFLATRLDGRKGNPIVAKWLDGKPPRRAADMARSLRAAPGTPEGEDGGFWVRDVISLAVSFIESTKTPKPLPRWTSQAAALRAELAATVRSVAARGPAEERLVAALERGDEAGLRYAERLLDQVATITDRW